MNLENEYYDLIVRYSMGELSEDEQRAFEKELEAGDEKAATLTANLSLFNEITEVAEQFIKESSEFVPEYNDELSDEHREIWNIVQSARDDCEGRRRNRTEWIDQLIQSVFEVDDVPEEQPDSLDTGFYFYKERDYKNAIECFESSSRGSSDKDDSLTRFYSNYYMGLCFMGGDDFSQAISELKDAINNSPNDLWKGKAQWYLALAYLKTHQIERGKDLLKEVNENDESAGYREKAFFLLHKMEQ